MAHAVHAKLFRKEGGTRIFIPSLRVSVSQDIIIIPPEWWVDILQDGEGDAVPIWNPHPNAGEPEKWIDVSGVALPGQPEPGPTPPNPNPEPIPPDAEWQTRIERKLDRLLSVFRV